MMASDAADALAKTYARNKKLLSLRSITNGLQQTGLLVACTYRASNCDFIPRILVITVGEQTIVGFRVAARKH